MTISYTEGGITKTGSIAISVEEVTPEGNFTWSYNNNTSLTADPIMTFDGFSQKTG